MMTDLLIYSALVLGGGVIGVAVMAIAQANGPDTLESTFDTERLDYLEVNSMTLWRHRAVWSVVDAGRTCLGSGATPREAIDNSRKTPTHG